MDVRALATARPDVAAYELTGADLQSLHQEAQRLCPQGADVLRRASQGQVRESTDSRWRATMTKALAWADPPDRAAQLVVLCRGGALAKTLDPLPATVDHQNTPSETSAALPIGPISPEW